jgi:DNA-binding NarL/FixJ family response regulator
MHVLQTAVSTVAPVTDTRPLVLIVDTHDLCRERLASKLAGSRAFFQVRTAPADPLTIVATLERAPFAVLVVSCCSDAIRPVPVLASVRARVLPVAIIMLRGASNHPIGIFKKHLALDSVVDTVEELPSAIDSALASRLVPWRTISLPPRRRSLTPREAQITEQVALGLRNAQIAEVIGIAEKTVKVNLTNIYVKLGIRSRQELTTLAPQVLPQTASTAAPLSQ